MTPPPAEKVAEPFTKPFRVVDSNSHDGADFIIDANNAHVDPQWLCARLNAAAPAPSGAQGEREACPLCERDAASRPNSDEREGDDQRLLGLTKADPSALAWLKQLKVWAYWHYNERAAALYATHQARASAGSAMVDARAAAEETKMNRILALSNEEVIAETIATGEDPQEVATRGRAILEAAIVANRERVAAAHAHAISQSNSAFQQVLMRVAFTAGAEWQRTYQFAHTHSAPPALTEEERDAVSVARTMTKSCIPLQIERASELLAIIDRVLTS